MQCISFHHQHCPAQIQKRQFLNLSTFSGEMWDLDTHSDTKGERFWRWLLLKKKKKKLCKILIELFLSVWRSWYLGLLGLFSPPCWSPLSLYLPMVGAHPYFLENKITPSHTVPAQHAASGMVSTAVIYPVGPKWCTEQHRVRHAVQC